MLTNSADGPADIDKRLLLYAARLKLNALHAVNELAISSVELFEFDAQRYDAARLHLDVLAADEAARARRRRRLRLRPF